MKRAAGLAMLLLVVASLGAARWSAGAARDVHDALVSGLATTPSVHVTAHAFESGWFASDALVEFELSGRPAERLQQLLVAGGREHARARLGFRLTQEVRHGPAVLWESREKSPFAWVAASSQLELDRELQADLTQFTGRVPALWLETRVSPAGVVHCEIAWPGLSFRVPAETTSLVEGRIEGIDGAFEISADAQQVQGSLGGAGLALTFSGMRLELGDFELALGGARHADGWQLNALASHASQLSWARAGEPGADPAPALSLGGLRADYRTEPHGDALAFTLDLASESGSLLGVPLGEGSASLRAAGFDARSLLGATAAFEPFRLRLATGVGAIEIDGSARLAASSAGLLGPFAPLQGDLRARFPSALVVRSGPGGVDFVEALHARGWLREEAGTLVVSTEPSGADLAARADRGGEAATASAPESAPAVGMQLSPAATQSPASAPLPAAAPPAAPAD